jgi:nucleoid-associated protein YgaU
MAGGGNDSALKPLPNAGRTMTPLEQPLGPTPTPVDTVQVPARPMTKSMTPESAPAERAVAFAPGSIQHVVQAGENFWTISRLYYGKGRYYKALWKANQDRVPAIDKLYVGMSVRVPPPESLDASLVEPARDAPTATASKPASRPRPAPTRAADGSTLVMLPIGESTARSSSSSRSSEPLEPRSSRPIHVVRDRETLRSIARDTLGDARRADEIENLNRDVIVDVSALEPGMRLRLPADARVRR